MYFHEDLHRFIADFADNVFHADLRSLSQI